MRLLPLLLSALGLVACAVAPSPTPMASTASDVAIECGPIADPALCRIAIEVAVTAKLNPPPMVAAHIRRPDPDDPCTKWFHECGPEAVIVVIQSGDTLQDVPLVRTTGGWVRLDLVR
jgi:hypothetical protein